MASSVPSSVPSAVAVLTDTAPSSSGEGSSPNSSSDAQAELRLSGPDDPQAIAALQKDLEEKARWIPRGIDPFADPRTAFEIGMAIDDLLELQYKECKEGDGQIARRSFVDDDPNVSHVVFDLPSVSPARSGETLLGYARTVDDGFGGVEGGDNETDSPEKEGGKGELLVVK
ncbi:uncharacterized protein STEHIDRAFT_160237 [Stereum hirsutum FP-91666 SS1]|uniref:uncharacterized protein n=1 Tax=Stereum hirsutum (strain FP-91666) TaxID=721885 RepID=UPI00044499D7|nr:uncharacterized protein STEHIDRAFT_160237 [Stereum hirsutum FP-91666 SS1]EIM83664.1 hypothetical protein STEHIDRAFT_160237 [Stereum hirsutum FP-91666 SS1]